MTFPNLVIVMELVANFDPALTQSKTLFHAIL